MPSYAAESPALGVVLEDVAFHDLSCINHWTDEKRYVGFRCVSYT